MSLTISVARGHLFFLVETLFRGVFLVAAVSWGDPYDIPMVLEVEGRAFGYICLLVGIAKSMHHCIFEL